MRLLRIGIAGIILFSASSYAGNQQNQLHHLVEEIKNVKNVLQQKHSKRDNLQQDLNKIETQYGEVSQTRRQTEQQIQLQKQKITALENTFRVNQSQLRTQQQALAQQLRLSYLLQRQGALTLLLNQQDISQTQRLLYYYQWLNQYRIHAIEQSQKSLAQINHQQQELYAQYQVLQTLKQKQQNDELNLALMKVNRAQLISTINQNISDQKQQLDDLFTNKTRLEQTLVHLTAPTHAEPINFSHLNFAAQRGHLPWPTPGSILHYFNKPIANSELKWNGEVIEAPDDQPVHAVAPGEVVFSKWLEGYGLLLIINHGNGYMTLYGRNHSLYKHEGDKVSAGEVISSVGQSGGYDKPALYFAIRYNAKPLDPNQWCS